MNQHQSIQIAQANRSYKNAEIKFGLIFQLLWLDTCCVKAKLFETMMNKRSKRKENLWELVNVLWHIEMMLY